MGARISAILRWAFPVFVTLFPTILSAQAPDSARWRFYIKLTDSVTGISSTAALGFHPRATLGIDDTLRGFTDHWTAADSAVVLEFPSPPLFFFEEIRINNGRQPLPNHGLIFNNIHPWTGPSMVDTFVVFMNGAQNHDGDSLYVYTHPQVLTWPSVLNSYADSIILRDVATGSTPGPYVRVDMLNQTQFTYRGNNYLDTISSTFTVDGFNKGFLIYVYHPKKDVGPQPVPIISPPNGATNRLLSETLQWTPISAPYYYKVQVSHSRSFADTMVADSGLFTSKSISGLAQGTWYYWRVIAASAYGVNYWPVPPDSFRTTAEWLDDPTVNNAICTSIHAQTGPTAVSDGAGGAIVCWTDLRNGSNTDIYARRVDASGVVQWTTNGVALSADSNNQEAPVMVSDGAGGAIIAWQDFRSGSNYDIYAQRVNSSGAVQWMGGGVPISSAAGDQSHPAIAGDGAGGAIITWQDHRGSDLDVYAQRVNAAGSVQWLSNGVPVSVATNDQALPAIVSDGAGGAVIAWQDLRGGSDFDMYSQRINASGSPQWLLNGVSVSAAASGQIKASITGDRSGGAIIAWQDQRSGGNHVYARRIDGSGTPRWTSDGVPISTASVSQYAPSLVGDGTGGAIIAFADYHCSGCGSNISAQRIDSGGTPQWTAGGIAVTASSDSADHLAMASDSAGGAIIAWSGFRPSSPGSGVDIYAQRVNRGGTLEWMAGGMGICKAGQNQATPTLVTDASEGGILAWSDPRTDASGDIYGQRILADGSLPRPGIIAGVMFNDSNSNGVRDPNEPGLAGWTVTLHSALGTPAITDAYGNFKFTNPAPGVHFIDEVLQDEWIQTYPRGQGAHTISFSYGDIVTGKKFGNVHAVTFTGSSGGNWSDPSNWGTSQTPGANDPVVIPPNTQVVVDNLTKDTILILRIQSGATLTFSDGVGPLTVAGNFSNDPGGTLSFPGGSAIPGRTGRNSPTPPYGTKATSGLVCNSDFVNKGSLHAGTSTITIGGTQSRTFLNAPVDGPASAFYNLELGGGITTSTGNIVVTNQLTLHGTLDPRLKDTIAITSNSPDAIADTGSITRGTVSRAIAQGDTAPYRFQTPSTFLKFDGTGSYPGALALTLLPDTVPTSFQLNWKVVPGVADTANNTVNGDQVVRTTRFAIGDENNNPPGSGTPVIGREFALKSTGGGGTAAAAIQLEYNQSEVPGSKAETPLHILIGPYVSDSVRPLWNMVSLPLVPSDGTKDSLFPGSTTPAFSYQGSYNANPTLSLGQGYWLRMSSARLITIFGADVENDTLPLTAGWNLIGGLSFPVGVKSVTTLPPSQISSRFFGYTGGYTPADSLRPMHGYWVKVKSDCGLALSTAGYAAKTAGGPSILKQLSRLILTDASGGEQALYFGASRDIDVRQYELPPAPPEGVFDARYSTQRMLELVERGSAREIPILISSAVFPMRIRWSLGEQDGIEASLVIDGKALPIERTGEVRIENAPASIRLRIYGGASPAETPRAFALMQNYPNPFNPSTTIRFEMPVESRVSLKIYNVMGQEIRTLIDGVLGVGRGEAEWNSLNSGGAAVSSGVYFYRINAVGTADPSKTFTRVKKMMLLR